MRTRRHHNNKGRRQIQRGKTREFAARLKAKYCEDKVTKATDHHYDPPPERRRYLLEEAEKVKGDCRICGEHRPLLPEDGCCGPCHYGCDKLVRQPDLQHGELCADCAFRPGSPEREPTAKYLHRDCLTELEAVLKQVREAGTIFYCHKPFLEPEQEWGFDPEQQSLVPLYGDHWRPCGGWVKAFNKEYGEKS